MSVFNEMHRVINLYYLGHYQQCINEASKITVKSLGLGDNGRGLTFPPFDPQDQSAERNIYLYRSYIAQKKYRVVMDEIDAQRMPELVPIRYIAEYFACPDKKNQILSALEKHELDAEELSDTWALSSAYIHYSEENYSEALR